MVLVCAPGANITHPLLLQGRIKPENIIIEPLHAVLNTGNTWFEVARNCLQYAVTADGQHVRDVVAAPPHLWTLAKSGSRQSKAWLQSGSDLEALVQRQLRMRKPITKYHGNQINDIYINQNEMFDALKGVFDVLRASGNEHLQQLPDKLQTLFFRLRKVHHLLQDPNACPQAAEDATIKLREVQAWFTKHELAPFRTTVKWYDHAIEDHLVMQMTRLQQRGLSIAALSSKYLEALNKTVKGIMKRLPGGGTTNTETGAHLVVVQAYKRLWTHNLIKRLALLAMHEEAFVQQASVLRDPPQPQCPAPAELRVPRSQRTARHRAGAEHESDAPAIAS